MIKRIGFAAALLVLTSPVMAATGCYNPAEVQAEQLLRLHSELMVIAVTCHQGSQGQDLGRAYAAFTSQNIGALHDAEQTLIGYYEKTSGGDGVSRLDRLRTLLANEFGQEIANLSAPAFCAQRRDKILELMGLRQETLANMATSSAARTYNRPCNAAMQTARK